VHLPWSEQPAAADSKAKKPAAEVKADAKAAAASAGPVEAEASIEIRSSVWTLVSNLLMVRFLDSISWP
jgi:hypothetical protein